MNPNTELALPKGVRPEVLSMPAEEPRFGAFEPYVDEHVIARFLLITPRRVLEMARRGQLPAHPIGGKRKTWRFLVSEVAANIAAAKKQPRATMAAAVPGTKERNRIG